MKKEVIIEQNRHCTTEGTKLHMHSSSKLPLIPKITFLEINFCGGFLVKKKMIFSGALCFPSQVILYSNKWLNITLITMKDFCHFSESNFAFVKAIRKIRGKLKEKSSYLQFVCLHGTCNKYEYNLFNAIILSAVWYMMSL